MVWDEWINIKPNESLIFGFERESNFVIKIVQFIKQFSRLRSNKDSQQLVKVNVGDRTQHDLF